jgi:hypothetical protein
MNEHVTFEQPLEQTFDVVSPRTKACNLSSTRCTPNKKTTNKKRQISKETPSILRAIKKILKLQKKCKC